MTIAVGASVYTGGTYTGTTLNSAAQTTQASGSSFAVFCIGPSPVTFTPSDSKVNAYTLQGTQQNNTSDGTAIALYLAQNGVGGSGHTFGMDMSVHAGVTWFAAEITGGATSGILDQFYGNWGTLGDPMPGPVTTTSANELILAMFQNNGTTATALTPGAGFGAVITNLSAGNILASRVVSATGTYDPSITFAPSGGRTQIITASFIAASSGSPSYFLGNDNYF